MYGKAFASMYSGSLFGKPAIVFAVWGYAIANMRPARKDSECYVEINPTLLAATFTTSIADVIAALDVLESPDPASRNTREDGRRLVPVSDQRHAGPMQYRVVNGAAYRAIRDEESRRTQNREAKRAERRLTAADIADIPPSQPESAQVEVEVDSKKTLLSDAKKPRRTIPTSELAESFDQLWSLVPRKEGRRAALKNFDDAIRDGLKSGRTQGEIISDIEKGIRNYAAANVRTDPQFIMRGGRLFLEYTDYVNAPKITTAPNHRSGDAHRPEGIEGLCL